MIFIARKSLLPILFLAACNGANSSQGLAVSASGSANDNNVAALSTQSGDACSVGTGTFRCLAQVRLDNNGQIFSSVSPLSGLTPADIQAAYNLPAQAPSGATVALVDAYDDASAESDLAVFRAQYNLPACTTANGCFRKVNQDGLAAPLPAAPPSNDNWTQEIALDLDAVSSACPTCNILLIEATDDNGPGLYISQNTAASLGATVISNSWGGAEYDGELTDDATYFVHPGISTFVASGDKGYAASFPPVSPNVVAVGGTHLKQDSTTPRGWSETVWGGWLRFLDGATGSGCSVYEPQPTWQTNSSTGCTFRAANDVAAVADPLSGLATYNAGSWQVVGGTSLASPLVAAMYALTGNGAAGPAFSYSHSAAFYDVTSGDDGSCSPSILCNAGAGWDGPTGNGTPNGQAMLSAAQN